MFFAFMIQVVFCCQTYEKEKYIYPTEKEYYTVFMNELFKGEDMIFECKNCPENVTLSNTMNLIGKPFHTGYIFRSIANNQSHFVALSDKNTINIYDWSDQSLKTVQIIYIHSDLYCFNVIFTLEDEFLLDCYLDNILKMYYLDNDLYLRLVYETNVTYPLKSNLYSFRSFSINYTIYAQYYDDYQILTLLKCNDSFANQTFVNISTWISTFQDVEISIKGIEVNTFYVLSNPAIILLQITEDENFFEWDQFSIYSPVYQMTIYQSLYKYSECDQLFLKSDSLIYSILVCQDYIDQELYQQTQIQYNLEENVEIKQFYANDLFLILQTNTSLMIISLESKTLLRQTKMNFYSNFSKSEIYFNSQNNQLFIFNDYTFVYQIEMPKLSGQYQLNDSNNNKNEIYIFASHNLGINHCVVQLKVQTLTVNDYGIYLLYENQIDNYYTLQQKKFVQQIKNINGPLLDITTNQNNQNLGIFKNIYFEKNYDFHQQFDKMAIINIQNTYVVGIYNNSMKIFIFDFGGLLFPSSQIDLNINNYVLLQDLQLAYQFQEQQVVLIIGINFDQNLLLFYFATLSFSNVTIISNTTVQTLHFNQFLLTYNCYMLMFENKILLYTFDNVEQFQVNQNTIQKYLQIDVDFNPTGMTVNQQHQSSIVFVSNNNNFLIFVIDFTMRMIPYGIYYVDYTIQQINIVNQKLILSYKCNQGLCFDVWNIQNLYQPFYEKQLMNITQVKDILCYSDNLFYYVKLDDKQTLVYNPILSYHQSLFTSIQLNGSYFSSTVIKGLSVLAFDNALYSLLPIFTFEFIPNDDFQTFDYLPNTIYNFTIRSQLNGDNESYITNNQSLTILNPQLNIYIQNISISIKDGSTLRYIYTFDNVSTIGQIVYFQLQPEQEKHQDYIKNFQNAVELSMQIPNQNQFTIVTVVNNQFVLQSFNGLMIFNTTIVLQFKDIQNCFQSYAQNDTLYTYCENASNYYIISYQITNESIIQNDFIILLPIQGQLLLDTPFSFISDGIFYLNNFLSLCYYNFKSQQNDVNITQCNTFSLQSAIIKYAEHYNLIVVFFLCQNEEKYINYIIGNYSKISNKMEFQKFSTINILNIYFTNLIDLQIQYLSIIKVELKEILMLITTNEQLCFLILLNVNYGIKDIPTVDIKFQDIISTVAPYNTEDFSIVSTPQIQGSTLLIALNTKQAQRQILLLIYDLTDIQQYNRSNPIRLQGGYTIPQIQSDFLITYQLMSQSRNKGYIMVLTSSNIYYFNYSTFTFFLDMPLYSKERDITFRLTGGNSYFTTIALIEVKYETQKGWIYGLNTIIATILIISLIYCWQKRKAPTDFDLTLDEWIDF